MFKIRYPKLYTYPALLRFACVLPKFVLKALLTMNLLEDIYIIYIFYIITVMYLVHYFQKCDFHFDRIVLGLLIEVGSADLVVLRREFSVVICK